MTPLRLIFAAVNIIGTAQMAYHFLPAGTQKKLEENFNMLAGKITAKLGVKPPVSRPEVKTGQEKKRHRKKS